MDFVEFNVEDESGNTRRAYLEQVTEKSLVAFDGNYMLYFNRATGKVNSLLTRAKGKLRIKDLSTLEEVLSLVYGNEQVKTDLCDVLTDKEADVSIRDYLVKSGHRLYSTEKAS